MGALLALVAGQDVEPAESSDGSDGRWRISRTVAEHRAISTVDPDARHPHKTVHRRTAGFAAHVVGRDTGLITATARTAAADAASGEATIGLHLPVADASIDRPIQVRAAPAGRPLCHTPVLTFDA